MAPKRLLAVWAHPDDEAFGPVGTMALAHAQGWQTAIVTATRGNAGKSHLAKIEHGQTLGDVREAELRAALDVLGVDQIDVWQYPDGGLQQVAQDELAAKVLDVMRQWRPTVVITFGPDGITGHPDHIAISSATQRAFGELRHELGPDGPQWLYFVTVRPGQEIEHSMGEAPSPKPPTTIVDVGQYERVKREALACHASQKDDWGPMLEDREWLTTDHFYRAFPLLVPGEPTELTILHE